MVSEFNETRPKFCKSIFQKLHGVPHTESKRSAYASSVTDQREIEEVCEGRVAGER